MSMVKPEIESWEDRSGGPVGPHSFGYVYFTDGSRVGYSNIPDTPVVWQPRTNGGGQYVEVTPAHLRMAEKLLRKEGVIAQ